MSPSLSKAEGQRKLSQILSEKRKKDPSGLLKAQREGTLNEYLREDLARFGLAVADSGAAGTRTASPSSPNTTSKLPAAGVPPAQRHSYRDQAKSIPATVAGARNSATSAASPPSADPSATAQTVPGLGSLARVGGASIGTSTLDHAVSEKSGNGGTVPEKIDSSRFETFAGRSLPSGTNGKDIPVSREDSSSGSSVASFGAATSSSASASASASATCRRWTVGHPDTPLTGNTLSGKETDTLKKASDREEISAVPLGGVVASEREAVGSLAEKFGGRLKIGQSATGSEAEGAPQKSSALASVHSSPLKGRRTNSGRIAELARRFEK